MKLHRYSAAVLACAFALGACQQGEKSSKDEDEKTPPVPVEVSLPVRGDVYAIYSGTAPIEAFARADVIAKVPGEVREILVEEGDDVEAGQILARLDGDRLRLELNESKARLRKLERDFQRNEDLRKKGLVSEGDFDEIQFELEALQAAYNLASLELDYTQIRAPISGVVSERFIKLGNTLEVSDPVFSVTSLEPLVTYLHVPEREYRQIAPGQPVGIDIDALAGTRILAEVTRVSPVVDPDTGTFKITIEISDAERRIKPGMFGRMSIVYDRRENALQVPRSAVVEEMGTTSVFVVEDNVAIRKSVKTGFSNDGRMEIVDGLVDGDRVVTVGQVGLKPDAEVSVINAPDAESEENSELADASSDGEN
ncbi:MAG: efflux RND transporter periplasmic adaptor subunit [Woeseiaceae bacterium]